VTVGIGLIGCGQWGLNYLRAFSDLEGCQVVAACDVSPQRLREAERRSRDLRTTSDLGEIIGDPQIQAVVIATPATQHYPTVVAALEAGKDCLVEKPMTADVDEARRLRELAKRSGHLLMVGHVFRFNPAINFIQRLLAAGGLGEPTDVRLKLAIARRALARLPAGAAYVDVSVPERPVAGPDNPQLSSGG